MTWLDVARDVLALLGLVLLATGFWLIYPPSALIAAGALLVLVAIAPALRRRRS